jgi:hypothetical protein
MNQYNLGGTEIYNKDGQTVADIAETPAEVTNKLLDIKPGITVLRVKATGKEGRVVTVGRKGMVLLDINDLGLFSRTVFHISELETLE